MIYPWDPVGSRGTGDPCPFGQSSVLLTSVFCVVFWGWVQPAPNRFCKRYLLGYMPEQSKLYLIDKKLNVTVLANAARAWQISTWHVHDMYTVYTWYFNKICILVYMDKSGDTFHPPHGADRVPVCNHAQGEHPQTPNLGLGYSSWTIVFWFYHDPSWTHKEFNVHRISVLGHKTAPLWVRTSLQLRLSLPSCLSWGLWSDILGKLLTILWQCLITFDNYSYSSAISVAVIQFASCDKLCQQILSCTLHMTQNLFCKIKLFKRFQAVSGPCTIASRAFWRIRATKLKPCRSRRTRSDNPSLGFSDFQVQIVHCQTQNSIFISIFYRYTIMINYD